LGVRATKTKKLLGFISGTPTRASLESQDLSMSIVNFLCVHKKLRSKRLAPMLVRELTRRINLQGTF